MLWQNKELAFKHLFLDEGKKLDAMPCLQKINSHAYLWNDRGLEANVIITHRPRTTARRSHATLFQSPKRTILCIASYGLYKKYSDNFTGFQAIHHPVCKKKLTSLLRCKQGKRPKLSFLAIELFAVLVQVNKSLSKKEILNLLFSIIGGTREYRDYFSSLSESGKYCWYTCLRSSISVCR